MRIILDAHDDLWTVGEPSDEESCKRFTERFTEAAESLGHEVVEGSNIFPEGTGVENTDEMWKEWQLVHDVLMAEELLRDAIK